MQRQRRQVLVRQQAMTLRQPEPMQARQRQVQAPQRVLLRVLQRVPPLGRHAG